MRISVAMCTYQGSRFLREQLESILSQQRVPDELIVSDDGSQDQTRQIIEELKMKAPFDVRLMDRERRLGTTKNFETCIAACTGDVIALSDQDDVWYPGKLARQAAVLESDRTIGAVFSDADLIDENSELLGIRLWSRLLFRAPRGRDYAILKQLSRELLRHDVITGATLMIRADLRPTILPIPASWVHDGWIAWIAALTSCVAALPDPLIQYRIHRDQQIGLGPTSLAGKIRRERARGHHQYLAMATRFGDLRHRLSQVPGTRAHAEADEIERKIRHAEFQAALPTNYCTRALQIAVNYRQYRKYSLGARTMCKDLFL